jgi:hypothetical protein
MSIMIDAAWKDIVVDRTASAFEPCQQTRSCVSEPFGLNRPTCFVLHHDCVRPDLSAAHNVSNFHPYQVASAKLAIDRKVKQCAISQAMVPIEVEPDLPYLLWLQRTLRTDGSSHIPDLTFGRNGLGLSHFHGHSPMPGLAI